MKTSIFAVFIIAFFAIVAIFPKNSFAQTLIVKDSSNFEAIEGVAIFNADKKKSVVTNDFGKADLSGFEDAEILTFQHASYSPVSISKAILAKKNYQIFLQVKMNIMNEVYISANRWEEDAKTIPNQISKITASQIALTNPQTAADLIGLSGTVFIQKSQLGGGSPMFRGFNANAVLITVDGVRMNNCIFRSGNVQSIIQLDGGSIESAEVLFGPGAVMYGSDALGGVMDLRTKSAKYAIEKPFSVNGSAFSRYSSANSEKTNHIDVNLAGKNWASLTSFTYSDFGNMQAGRNRPSNVGENVGKRDSLVVRIDGKDKIVANSNRDLMNPSSYNQINLSQKFNFRINDKLEVQYGFHFSNSSNIDRYDRLIELRNNRLRYAEWYYGPQKWMMNSLKINFLANNKFFDFAKFTFARQDVEESRYTRTRANDWLGGRVDNVVAYSANIDFEKTKGKHQFYYGLDLLYNTETSAASQTNITTNEVKPLDTRYPSGGSTWRNSAAYFNYKVNMTEKVTLNAGLRYTNVGVNSKFTDKTFYPFPFDEANVTTGAINGSFSVIYRPQDDFKISLMASTGFRSPNVDDIGKIFEISPKTVVVPNTNLKPEYTYNAEFGISKTFFDKIQLSGNAFYTIYNSAITTQLGTFNGKDSIMYNGSMARVVTQGNADKGYIWGYSAEAKIFFSPKVFFTSSINYTFGQDKDTKLAFQGVVPMFGQSAFQVRMKKFDFWLSAKYMAASVKFTEMSPESSGRAFMHGTADKVPAWVTLNFKAMYKITPNFSFNFGVDNILDRYYLPHASGIPELGRNFIIAGRFKF